MREFRRISEDVDSLEGAWMFVMAHIDSFSIPNVEIQSVTPVEGDPYFSVTVYGDVG